MRTVWPLLGALLAPLFGCGGAMLTAHTPTPQVTLHWRVDTVTRSRNGGDVDDGPLFVALVVSDRIAATLPAGRGLGRCTTDPSFRSGRVCAEKVVGTLVTRLVCAGDPHVDRVVCFDAVRTGARSEVLRYEYDVPVVDVVDGGPPPPTLVGRTSAGWVDLGGGDVKVGATEFRDVAQ
jgi:hypothetical protein